MALHEDIYYISHKGMKAGNFKSPGKSEKNIICAWVNIQQLEDAFFTDHFGYISHSCSKILAPIEIIILLISASSH